MNKDNAIGMFMGLYIGDALGGPLEFKRPHEIKSLHKEMTGGGVHKLSIGEHTDDGAMSTCIADAYINHRGFSPAGIAHNYKQWAEHGTFGTRDYVFDIGNTCAAGIARMTPSHPYAGGATANNSGNGSIMRLAPVLLVNHKKLGSAIGESVASALMTHGNSDTIKYITAFAHEMYHGKMLKQYAELRDWSTDRPDGGGGSIMYAYNTAWTSVFRHKSFEHALVYAVNLGYDADTVGAVTGMLAGRIYGYSAIPKRWLEKLVKHDELLAMANDLYYLYEGD